MKSNINKYSIIGWAMLAGLAYMFVGRKLVKPKPEGKSPRNTILSMPINTMPYEFEDEYNADFDMNSRYLGIPIDKNLIDTYRSWGAMKMGGTNDEQAWLKGIRD